MNKGVVFMYFKEIGEYTPETIVARSDSLLSVNYRSVTKLIGGRIHSAFNSAIGDFDFLKIAIFNNDHLKIPPVETFLIVYGDTLPEMTEVEKKGIGAMFGNLFRFVFSGYISTGRKQYSNFTVASASYFKKT